MATKDAKRLKCHKRMQKGTGKREYKFSSICQIFSNSACLDKDGFPKKSGKCNRLLSVTSSIVQLTKKDWDKVYGVFTRG